MKFFKSLLADENGAMSSKRLIALICTLALCTLLFITSMYGKAVSPSETIIESITFICCVAMGATTADKFSLKKPPVTPEGQQ
jgi:phosphate/sulfate permease